MSLAAWKDQDAQRVAAQVSDDPQAASHSKGFTVASVNLLRLAAYRIMHTFLFSSATTFLTPAGGHVHVGLTCLAAHKHTSTLLCAFFIFVSFFQSWIFIHSKHESLCTSVTYLFCVAVSPGLLCCTPFCLQPLFICTLPFRHTPRPPIPRTPTLLHFRPHVLPITWC